MYPRRRLTDAEAAAVQEAAIPRQVLSGKYDPIAGQRYAQRLAEHLDCSLHVMGAALYRIVCIYTPFHFFGFWITKSPNLKPVRL